MSTATSQTQSPKASSSLVEITGKFLAERFRFQSRDPSKADSIIADIHIADRGEVTVKGQAAHDQLTHGMQYRFFGKWTKYKNKRSGKHEDQFAFNSFTQTAPVGRDAIIGYLVQNGFGIGLGKVRASALYDAFGDNAVAVARTQPGEVTAALKAARLHYAAEKAGLLAYILNENFATEAIKIDLTSLLNGRGFPRSIVDTVIAEWGNKAATVIRRDPFKLLTAKIKGCGFKLCDAMYLDLGLNPSRIKRQALAAWYSIERDTDGHTWFNWKTPDAFLRSNIAGYSLKKALSLAVRARLLAEIRTDGEDGPISTRGECSWYAAYSNAMDERDIADCVLAAESEKVNWPKLDGLNLTEHQKEKLSAALRSSIAILGGSPGTGKTWTVAELVKALADQVGLSNIVIGTPTGKAAVRVTENLLSKDIDLRARTWASLQMQLERESLRYFNSAVIAGDETSMNDTASMANIMRARAAHTKLLFVGDVHQLPPVGHGAPLRDLIAAGVAYGELTEIMRNSGGIVEACAAIREQKPWKVGDNLHMVETKENHLAEIEQILSNAKNESMNPVWDVQIVTAVNEKSPLGRVELNKQLQAMLNHQPGEEGVAFRVGDKLVNTKNSSFRLADSQDDEVYVANGELAKVLQIDRSAMILSLDAPARVIIVPFHAEGGCTFELGYALSVHKSQGSDWPWVIVVIDDYPGAKMVCDRAWLYTALSRSKEKCDVVGEKRIADQMCRVSKIWHRKTFLKELILSGRARSVLSGV